MALFLEEEALKGFSIISIFSNPSVFLSIRIAALGNFKASFHCTHWHNLSKGCLTSHPSLPFSEGKDVIALWCSEPLRSKVGGPSKACAMLCGLGSPGCLLARMEPALILVNSLFYIEQMFLLEHAQCQEARLEFRKKWREKIVDRLL